MRADLWLAVEGRGIEEGVGPSSVLTALLDAFRKGVQTVAEFLFTGQLSRRPTAALSPILRAASPAGASASRLEAAASVRPR